MSATTSNSHTETATTGTLVLKNRDTFASIGKIASEALTLLDDVSSDVWSKSYVMACAVTQLEKALTPEVMAPIMALQGSPLGFKTDKDKDGGYDMATVKRAVIAATLSGLRITGNEFNVIGGNCYSAVNGVERLFNSLLEKPARHEPGQVKIDEQAKRAIVTYKLTYKLRGQAEQTRELEIVTKLAYSKQYGNLLTTDEQVVGKARRKILFAILRELKGIELDMTPEAEPRNVTPEKTVKTDTPALPPASSPTVEAQAFNLEGAA